MSVELSPTAFTGPLHLLFGSSTAMLRPTGSALPVPPASDRATWAPESGAVDSSAVAEILGAARADIGTVWPQTMASAAARVHRDGDRDQWEQQHYARQRRLSRAAVAAAVTLEDRFVDEVADGIWQLAEQSSWCWPAHDDTMQRHGSVLATVTDPFLDLGAGEVVGQLAWLDHLLAEQLDRRYPGIRARIRHEARLRVIEPFLRRRDWHWLGLDGHVHNWSPWIHGNVLVAALALIDDGPQRDDVVRLVVEGIDRYVAVLPDDGAIDEGYAYWWNGACRALEALDILAFATDGTWDGAPGVPALRETVAFPHRMHLGGPWYVNLADGPARPPAHQPWHALHRAARAVGDDAARAHAAAHRHPGAPAATEHEGFGRLLRGLTDAAWLDARPQRSPLPADVWLPSTQVLLARPAAGSCAGLTVVAKGGHNGENHNHNDVGSFIVASDGVPVVVDAGRPTYTAQTFGPDRYAIWTMQSSWHNVPEIAGAPQAVGAEHAASDVAVDIAPHTSRLQLELSGAYAQADAGSWHRTVALDRGSGAVHVDDRWTTGAPGSTLHLLLAGEVTAAAGEARVIPPDPARPVRISWPSDAAYVLEVRKLDDPMLSEVWGAHLTRLEIVLDDRNALRVTIEQDSPDEDDHR
ncbi:heparinase II/III-family protein [Microbacterium sp. zg-YB36]|uniref:heparinase II/III-family protein n=1 Tax=Microbacterium sp. zg-YB36 TaxID=2969407 RepID=UPI00214C42A8|nr:heparinase II/III-family protein [Microbacterium sp. zg-YB36]MDL5351722.1 heparinase II/III-family protein [Microbacterium sp. zg-YB36]